LIFEGTEKVGFTFSVPSKQCAEPLPYLKKPSMSGFLIEGAQRAEPLQLNRGTEKVGFTFSVPSDFHLFYQHFITLYSHVHLQPETRSDSSAGYMHLFAILEFQFEGHGDSH
jgi:hypothetical protein